MLDQKESPACIWPTELEMVMSGCTKAMSGSAKQNLMGSQDEEVLYQRQRVPDTHLCVALNLISKDFLVCEV